jgi:class 3 adenylate cyclase/tetratricopeptide (TPR) repeat protein
MAVCPNCGNDNPGKAKFCSECGKPLKAAQTAPVEERKVISVLFVDLVGFTARSHGMDPEDVRAALAPYHQRLRTEIERFGGTVEKFIGDAVMAVFGAPVAHEDDAERAVRAALRIIEAIDELNDESNLGLSIRAAVNTGEGLVNLSARPQAGEGMVTGDVVNTASRLQTIAPVNGLVVGEITYRSTKDVIVYEEMKPVTIKGKPEPVPIWRALSARSRFGIDIESRYRTPFVGREVDLTLLKATYQRALRESSLQLMTVIGEPGVGKSRLLAEFARYVDEQPDLVTWRQGRSLPYGEGITFWALGEIVKAEAGINESDSPEVASSKLATSVGAVVEDESDRAWLHARLAPLVGAASVVGGSTEKEESFTAWLRFLEAIASSNPLVLVFEDLHWADAALLEFIEHLVEWSTGVPLLIVGTARPELFENHPHWAGGTRNATTISLSPLTDAETAQLISALLSQAVLPAEIHAALLDRAGGNPLYAEEFIRMLTDRGVLHRRGRALAVDPDADFPMPENVQALIAARLDTLSAEHKSLLHNAAVVGKVFWSGAVGSLSELEDRGARGSLHELVRKELIRPARTSSIEGQEEYSFCHALIRDVAYSQIPRAIRGQKHRGMAKWMETIAGDRVGDHAEVLVHHYIQALDLARSAASRAAEDLEEPTRRFLILAGDRASNLDPAKASNFYRRALDLLPSGHPERARTLTKAGESAVEKGALEESKRYLEEAVAEARRCGDLLSQGQATARLSMVNWWQGGDPVTREALLSEAIRLLESYSPGPELANGYVTAAGHALLSGRPQLALEWSEKAMALALAVDDKRSRVIAALLRASARCELGDLRGLDDERTALRDALRLGLGEETSAAYSNLAEETWWVEGANAGKQEYGNAIEFGERRGLKTFSTHAQAELLRVLFDVGDWDEITVSASDLAGWGRAHGHSQVEVTALYNQAQVCLWRGQTNAAVAIKDRLLELARRIQDLQVLVPGLATVSLIDQAVGNDKGAVALVNELEEVTRQHHGWRARQLPTAIRILVSTGHTDEIVEFLSGMNVTAARDRHCLLTGRAIAAEGKKELENAVQMHQEAAQRWADYGFVLEKGQAHLGLARCLIGLGDREAATEPLHNARAIFSRLRAVPLIEEVDHHLGQATALSS